MKRTRKFLLSIALISAMCVVQIGTTMAYLQDTSNAVVNTFSGGAIAIMLDEALVNVNGEAETDADRVTANSYKYESEAVVDKDPTVTVLSGSEACYVFMVVDNGLPSSFDINYKTSSENGAYWVKVAESGTKTVYAYSEKVEDTSENVKLEPLFTKVTMPKLTNKEILAMDDATVTLESYAVQIDSISEEQAVSYAVEALGLSASSVTATEFLAG